MKQKLLLLLSVALLAACSSPKYTYQFDRYQYRTAKSVPTADENIQGPAAINPLELTASIENTPALAVTEPAATEPVRKTYAQMNKQERKALRQHIKAEVKAFSKEKKEVIKKMAEKKLMDSDLRLAAIFGAVGLTGLILGGVGEAFTIIGAIALLIGVVFFVKWLVRQ